MTDTQAAPRRRIGTPNIVGLGLGAAGLFVLALSAASARWYDQPFTVPQGDSIRVLMPDLTGVRTFLTAAGHTPGVSVHGAARSYYGWGVWVTLAVTGLLALAENTPQLGGRLPVLARRLVGLGTAVLAALSIVWTFLAVALFDHPGYGDWFGHLNFGFWAALAGFVLIGAGAVTGALVRPVSA